MRTKKRFPFYLFGIVLFFALLFSCEEKPDFIGGDLLPSGDNFIVLFDSMEVIHGFPLPGDSIPAGYKNNFLLGAVEDQFFGISQSEIITTLTPSINSGTFGDSVVVDSVILFIAPGEIVGDGLLPIQIKIYELTEFISIDSTYYTSFDITGKFRDKVLGSASLLPGDTLLKIFIEDEEFINKFITAEDSVLSNILDFQELMNGLYYATEGIIDQGNIAKIDFDDAENKLSFYYTNSDTTIRQSQDYTFGSTYNRRINMFNHITAGYDLDGYLNNGSKNDSLIFLQSMAGVRSEIHFPGLNKWIDSMPVAINQARLILPIADTIFTGQKEKYFPESISLYRIKEDGKYDYTFDEVLDAKYFGGEYDGESGTYSFTMKVQMQTILADTTQNLGMVLVPVNASVEVTRAALYGWSSDPRKRMRLEITYTKL